jgi:O-antigen/teichoic acid export membrane protein
MSTPEPAQQPPGVATDGPARSAGARAVHGSVWMICASGVSKFLGFACQLALAWFLTKRDFGVYAIAISLAVILTILRDGGLPMVLEQKGRAFVEFAGPALWLMFLINGATGLVIFLIAEPAARYYGIAELKDVIRLFGMSVPLCVLPSILVLRLSVDLRFRELSLIQLVSAVARNGLLFAFAASGYGALSFILPQLIGSLLDTAMLWYATRRTHWDWRPKVRYWRELFAAGRWVTLGTFAIAISNSGAYFILGKCLPSETLGTYFFAFQLIVQLGTLLGDNAYQVLFATFVRMDWNLGTIREGVRKALQTIVVGGAWVSLGIAAVYDPLQALLWGGKWSSAGPPIDVLAFVWPAVAMLSVLRAVQMAIGHFRQWGALMLTQALLSIAGASAGALVGGSAFGTALGYAAGIVIGATVNSLVALDGIGMRARDYPWSTFSSWLWLAAAALAAHAIGGLAHHPIVQVLTCGLSYCLLALIGLRLLGDGALTLALSSAQRAIAKRPFSSRLAARLTGS